jgi:hypothetical protein
VGAASQCLRAHTMPSAMALAWARKIKAAMPKPLRTKHNEASALPPPPAHYHAAGPSRTHCVSAQAGTCDAVPLSLQPHAAAPTGSREPRTAEPPRPAHTSAYTYEAHRPPALGRSHVNSECDRRRAALALHALCYWLLVVLVVAVRSMGIARSVVVATGGRATTRPAAPPKRCTTPRHSDALLPTTLRCVCPRPSASSCRLPCCALTRAPARWAIGDPRVAAGAHRKWSKRPARSLGRRRWREPSPSCAAWACSRCS